MDVEDRVRQRVDEINYRWENPVVKGVVFGEEYAEEPEVEHDSFYVDSVDGFTVCFVDRETGLGIPTPERLERMVDEVDLTGGGNIVHGYIDLFGDITRKFYDLYEDKMEEAEVSFEGERELTYDDPETSRIETLRFKTRVEGDADDFDEEKLKKEARSDLLDQCLRSVYSGRQVQDIKVNSPPPTDDEEELREMEWTPDRIKVGELVFEFDTLLIGDDEQESSDETVEVEIEEVGDDVLR